MIYFNEFHELIGKAEILHLNIINSLWNIMFSCIQLAGIKDYLLSNQFKTDDKNKQHLTIMVEVLDSFLVKKCILLNYSNAKRFSNECWRLQYYIYYYKSMIKHDAQYDQSLVEAKETLENELFNFAKIKESDGKLQLDKKKDRNHTIDQNKH